MLAENLKQMNEEEQVGYLRVNHEYLSFKSLLASEKEDVKFLVSILESEFRYIGIDNADSEELKKNPYLDKVDPQAFKHIKERREVVMSEAYLTTAKSVVGRIGLAHLKAIQNHTLTQLSPEEANSKFKFLYLYTESNPLLKFIRYMQQNYPFAYNQIYSEDTTPLVGLEGMPLPVYTFDLDSITYEQIQQSIAELINPTFQASSSVTFKMIQSPHRFEDPEYQTLPIPRKSIVR